MIVSRIASWMIVATGACVFLVAVSDTAWDYFQRTAAKGDASVTIITKRVAE
jgi:hypothetical protein